MIYKNKQVYIIVLLFLFAFNWVNVFGEEVSKKAVIVILPEINYNDFTDIKEIGDVIEESSIGIMNVRGNSISSRYSSYVSINTGTRGDGLREHCFVDPIENGYKLRNFEQLKKFNENNHYGPEIGLLGDSLRSGGIQSSLICFVKEYNYEYVPSSLILTDKNGKIDNINFINVEDITGVNTVLTNTIQQNDLTVIDTHNIEDIDTIISSVKEIIDKDDLLMILSPYYLISSARRGDRLTPLLIKDNQESARINYSNTTRRKGITGIIDITPTLLSYFDIDSNTTGERVVPLDTSNNIDFICDLVNIISFNTKFRFAVLKSYVLFQIILLFTIQAVINIKRGSIREIFYVILKCLTLFTLICPFILLIMPIFKITNLTAYFLVGISVNIMLLLTLCYFVKNDVKRVIIVSLLTSGTIVLDIVTGTNLGKFSLLSYDPVIGARYYGLGNEYMGILISSTLVGLVPIFNRNKKYFIPCVVLLISVIPIIGLTMLGANVGGTITATVAFVYVILSYINKNNTVTKNIIYISIFVFLTVFIFSIYDLYFSTQKSHLAKALIGINNEGLSFVSDIIFRKISMNLKLLFFTIWSQVLIVTLIVLSVLVVKPKGLMYHMIKKYSYIAPAWKGSLLAGMTGLFVNDSGVVVAATCNIFFAFSLLYLLLEENPDEIRKIRENRN